jgi:hypothetical protein
MKKFALGLASAGAFAALTVGLATPAFAATSDVTRSHDAVYSTQTDTATYQPVSCSVHVNHNGTDVNVSWC